MTGAASANAFEQFFSTTVNAGSSSISATPGSSGNFDVTLGAITRVAGGAVNFTLPTGTPVLTTNGIATTTQNNTAGILGGYATVGGNWAVSGATAGTISSVSGNNITFSAAQTAGNEVVFTSGTLPTGLSLNTPYLHSHRSSATSAVSTTKGGTAVTLTTTTSGAVVNSGINISALGSYTTLTATGGGTTTTTNFSLAGPLSLSAASPITANSLNITDTTAADALALGANNATFNAASGGLLYSGGTNYAIGGTGVIGAGTASEFIVTTTGSGILSINSPLISSTATAGSLTKAGSGTLVLGLGSAYTYTGATTVSGGLLQLGASTSLSSGDALATALGATFDINGNNQTLGTVTNAGTITSTIGTPTLTIGNGSTSPGSFAGLMNVIWNQVGTSSAISGSWTNTGNITANATGAGNVTLSGTLANTGNISLTTAAAGTLSVTGAVNNVGNLSASTGATAAGTITLSGPITNTGNISLTTNAATTAAPITVSSAIANIGNVTLNTVNAGITR